MLVKSLIEASVKGKKPKILCYKNDILNITADHGNVLIVHKNEGFAIKRSDVEIIEMTKEKLLESVKETITRTKDPMFFPYEILIGILETKDYVNEFAEMVKNSDIQTEIKNRIINEINTQIRN